MIGTVDCKKEIEAILNGKGGELHFGNLIKEILRANRRSVAWFAVQMHCDRSNMYKMLSRNHLDSAFLLRASQVLEFDLFLFASEWMAANSGSRLQCGGLCDSMW